MVFSPDNLSGQTRAVGRRRPPSGSDRRTVLGIGTESPDSRLLDTHDWESRTRYDRGQEALLLQITERTDDIKFNLEKQNAVQMQSFIVQTGGEI